MNNYWVQYLWQNVLPPSFWTLLGIGISHWHTHRKLDRNHDELLREVRGD